MRRKAGETGEHSNSQGGGVEAQNAHSSTNGLKKLAADTETAPAIGSDRVAPSGVETLARRRFKAGLEGNVSFQYISCAFLLLSLSCRSLQ